MRKVEADLYFYKALGYNIGKSMLEDEYVELAGKHVVLYNYFDIANLVESLAHATL